MSGESFPLEMPLARFATESCEATTLFEELRKPLLRYLTGLGLSAEEAQDVAQDAFLSLHKHLAQRRSLRETDEISGLSKRPTLAESASVGLPDPGRSLSEAEEESGSSKRPTQAKSALVGDAASVGQPENIRSWLFRVAHNRARNHQKSYEQRFGQPLDPVYDSASKDATPEQAVLAKEKFQRLDRAIGLLAAQERECLMLRAEGLRYREIGEVLGIPTSTVADIVERAIKKLAEKCNV